MAIAIAIPITMAVRITGLSRRRATTARRLVVCGKRQVGDVRRRRRALEDHANHDLAVAIDLVEHAAAYSFRVEESANGGLELDDEEIHADDL